MNSFSCVDIILKNIRDNAHLFEKNNEINKLSEKIYKLSSLAVQKSLPCSLFKSILMTLKQLNDKNVISEALYRSFLKDINNFYKSRHLCVPYKLAIVSCFTPAVEIELVSLLKLCATITNINELDILRPAVENSIVVQACLESKINLQKVIKILKEAFILSEGNPVVGYLVFHFFKLIEQSCYPCLLPKEVYCLDTFFHFPQYLLTCEEQELFIKQFTNLCIQCVNLTLCTKLDLIFYIAAFPLFYREMLNLCTKHISNSSTDFIKFLCSTKKLKPSEWSDICSAKENLFWTFI